MFEELAKCSECPLRKSKEKLGCVPGEGVGEEPYDAMWVGISPALTELKKKRPMIGSSGMLGRRVGERVGYKNYFITNSFGCYYPETATELHLKKAAECCKPRLLAEIEYFHPKLIVTLGDFPTHNLVGTEKNILSLEGHVIETEYGSILPVRQPAAVLYRQDEYPDFKWAMETGIRYLKGETKTVGEPETVIVDEGNIADVLERISQCPNPYVDLETTRNGFFPYGWAPDSIRSIGIAIDDKTGYIFPERITHHKGLKEIIDSTPTDYHNAHFDCGFLMQAGFEPKVRYDSLLAHYMLDERNFAHGLKLLARKYLNVPDWEQDLKYYLPNKKASYDLVPDEVLYPYQARDVVYGRALVNVLEAQVPATGKGVYQQLLIPCLNMFNEIRHQGIRIDISQLMNLDEKLEQDENELLKDLEMEVGYPLNPNSNPEVCHYLYDVLELPVSKQYGRSTTKNYLRNFQDIDAVRLIMETRQARKQKGTYVRGLAKFVDQDWRIHPFTKLWGAETGRISTEDPSIMNVSKKGGIKLIYLPEIGEWFAICDFKGMELVLYAIITRDKQLVYNITNGIDTHAVVSTTATQLLGRLVPRGETKTGVFGRMYGRGRDAMKRGFRMGDEETDKVIKLIDGMFPSLPQYNKWIKHQIHEKGELTSIFGRKKRIGVITDQNRNELYRQAANMIVSSPASDVNLFVMLHMWNKRKETGAKPLFPVHDSVSFSIQDPGMLPQIKEEMEKYAGDLTGNVVPFTVEIDVGRSWGEVKPMKEFLS